MTTLSLHFHGHHDDVRIKADANGSTLWIEAEKTTAGMSANFFLEREHALQIVGFLEGWLAKHPTPAEQVAEARGEVEAMAMEGTPQ